MSTSPASASSSLSPSSTANYARDGPSPFSPAPSSGASTYVHAQQRFVEPPSAFPPVTFGQPSFGQASFPMPVFGQPPFGQSTLTSNPPQSFITSPAAYMDTAVPVSSTYYPMQTPQYDPNDFMYQSRLATASGHRGGTMNAARPGGPFFGAADPSYSMQSWNPGNFELPRDLSRDMGFAGRQHPAASGQWPPFRHSDNDKPGNRYQNP
jgi:hypothetical protein